MLSLLGSIQLNPFSPEHIPDHTVQTIASKPQRQRRLPEPEPTADDIPDEAADSEEEDTFEMLGRLGDEASARRAKVEEDAKSAKKRKRKEAKVGKDAEEDVQVEKKKKKKKTS